jgi:hypothetical protein
MRDIAHRHCVPAGKIKPGMRRGKYPQRARSRGPRKRSRPPQDPASDAKGRHRFDGSRQRASSSSRSHDATVKVTASSPSRGSVTTTAAAASWRHATTAATRASITTAGRRRPADGGPMLRICVRRIAKPRSDFGRHTRELGKLIGHCDSRSLLLF